MAVLTTVAAGLGAAKAIADHLKFSNGSGLANGIALAGSDTYDTSDIQDVDLEKNKDDDVTDIIKHSILAKANGPDEDDSNPRQVKDVPDLEPMQRGAFSSVFETEPKSEPVYSSEESPEETSTSSSSETNNGDGPGTGTDIKATMKDTGSDSSGSFGNGLVMGSPSSVNSVNSVNEPGSLAIPPSTQIPQLNVNPDEVENPLLTEAQEAYDDDKDIDADELDYVKDEDAAEQVEDYVEAVDSGELEEDKAEEELEKAAEDGEVEKDELDMNLVKTLAKFVFPDTAEGSEDGIHLGGKESYDAADIKDVSLANDSPESGDSPDGGASGGPSFSSSVGSVSSGGSSKGTDFSSQESSAKSSAGSDNSLKDNSTGGSSSSGSSSSGSMKATFDKIMAGGIESKTSGGDSSFEDSGMSGGNVGSVEVKGNDEPLKIAAQNGQVPQVGGQVKSNPVTDAIHETIAKDWENWPERDGIHYKAKGSIGVFTENGEDVFVKIGKSKIQPLEEVDSSKLEFVEEIL